MAEKKKTAKENHLSAERLIFFIKAGVFLLMLTPLVVNPWNVFPGVFSKAIVFRILTELIFGAYLILILLNRDYLPRLNLVFGALMVFGLVSSLSVAFSLNPYRSFWGTAERMDGFVTQLHLLALFVVLTGTFKNRKSWMVILRWSVVASVLVALTGLMQKLGIASFSAATDPSTNGLFAPFTIVRVPATLGNPIFYASYLILIIFLSLFLAYWPPENTTPRSKKIFLGVAAVNFLMLLMTGTRGAWIGFMAGIAVLTACWLILTSSSKKTRLLVLGIILVLSLLLLAMTILTANGYLKNLIVWARFESIFAVLADPQNARLILWLEGVKIAVNRPVLGYGPEMFGYVFEKNYQQKFSPLIKETLYFDRSHSKMVDLLVGQGVIGVLSYLAMFGACLYVLFRQKERSGLLASLIMVSLLVAYFVQNLFAFDIVSAQIIFCLVLAFISAALCSPQEEARAQTAKKSALPKKAAILALAVSGAFVIYQANIVPYLSNLEMVNGQRLFINGKTAEGMSLFEKSFSRKDFTSFERELTILSMVRASRPFLSNQPQQDAERQRTSLFIEKLARSLEEKLRQPEMKPVRTSSVIAEAYKDLYLKERDERFLIKAEEITDKLLAFSSQFLTTYRFKGEILLLQNKEKEGLEYFEKAYEYDKDKFLLDEWTGFSLAEAGQGDRGAAILRKSLIEHDFYVKGNFNNEFIGRVANIYEINGSYRELANFYEEVLFYYPKGVPLYPQIYASLAAVYAKIGEREKAYATSEKMFALFPQLSRQKEEFLANLEADLKKANNEKQIK